VRHTRFPVLSNVARFEISYNYDTSARRLYGGAKTLYSRYGQVYST